jgi:hypothetical protein
MDIIEKEYMRFFSEAKDFLSRMTPKDKEAYLRYKKQLAHMTRGLEPADQRASADYYNITSTREIIKKIEDRYKTPDERKKDTDKKDKAYTKRADAKESKKLALAKKIAKMPDAKKAFEIIAAKLRSPFRKESKNVKFVDELKKLYNITVPNSSIKTSLLRTELPYLPGITFDPDDYENGIKDIKELLKLYKIPSEIVALIKKYKIDYLL